MMRVLHSIPVASNFSKSPQIAPKFGEPEGVRKEDRARYEAHSYSVFRRGEDNYLGTVLKVLAGFALAVLVYK